MKPQEVADLLSRRAAEGELERAQKQVSQIDLSGDLAAAKADRDSHLEQKEPGKISLEQLFGKPVVQEEVKTGQKKKLETLFTPERLNELDKKREQKPEKEKIQGKGLER